MRRAFYKSRLFWCGVPGLVFLLWVWWDSRGWLSYVADERGRELRQVEVVHGCVLWTYALDLKPSGSTAVSPRAGRGVLADENGTIGRRGFDFGPGFERKKQMVRLPVFGIEKEIETWRVGLWVIVAGYVVVWMGAVIAWQRRKARVMRGLTDAVREREVLG